MTTKQCSEAQWMASLPQVGTPIETLEDCRAIGGTIRRVNVGVIERTTAHTIFVRNEQGNVQKFCAVSRNSVPQIDKNRRSFFRTL